MTRLGSNYKTVTGKDGKTRIVETISPKLDASKKIAMRKSKKTKVVKRTV